MPDRRRQCRAACFRIPGPVDRQEVDGTDFIASYAAMPTRRANIAAPGTVPALVHARVHRPYSHSLSDDERLYKTTAEREAEAARDPVSEISRMAHVDEGMLDRQALQRIMHEIDHEVQETAQDAAARPRRLRRIGAASPVFDPVDPTSHANSTSSRDSRRAADHGGRDQLTLHEEMRRNDNIVVFGEDVADCSREENLTEVKGKGGVFKATAGPPDGVRIAALSSIRRSPRPPSSAARSAWRRAV